MRRMRNGASKFEVASSTISTTPSTFSQCAVGRWITLDAADLDGDGDDDIVLGSYIHGPTSVPPSLMEIWEKGNLPFLILRNERLRPGGK